MSIFSPADAATHAARVMRDCDEIAQHSETEGGLLRRYLSEPMHQVHSLASRWMGELGMLVRTDDAGNLIGRRVATATDATTADSAPVWIIGSHLDTVPSAGRYDGVLGFVMGIATVRMLAETALPFHIDVIGFSEEEGVRFQKPYLGSHAVTGTFDPNWLHRVDPQGISMRSCIEGFGLHPETIAAASYEPSQVRGFIEPHIEQGTMLSLAEDPVGAVSAIAGQTRSLVRFDGVAAHAGTTPMNPRSDALVAAAAWILEVSRVSNQTADCRGTVGYADVQPNVRNVIPDRVTLSLDLRHIDDTVREETVQRLYRSAAEIAESHHVAFEVLEEQQQTAARMDPILTDGLKEAMRSCGLSPRDMISGAGHDAGIMACHVPSAMLFIRQPRGISHHRDEDVRTEDVAVGLQVLFQFFMEFADGDHAAGANPDPR